MRKLRASWGCLAVTALAFLLMVLLPAAAPPTERMARVALCTVEKGGVEQLLALSGRVRYAVEYPALVPSDGLIAQVYVQPGQFVERGQALFRMDGTAAEGILSQLLASENALPAAASALSPEAQTLLEASSSSAAELLRARAAVEALTVRAQTDGLVQQVDVTEHSGAAAGTPAMLLTGDAQQVVCGAVRHDAEKLRCGMTARILSKGVRIGTGTVAQVAPASADTATGAVTHQVLLTLDGGLDLPLGAAVEAEVVLLSAQETATLPLQAVTENSTVWWLAEGRAWEVPVTVAAADEVSACVDLPLGAQVVVRGQETLIEGQRVREDKR